MNSFRIKFEEKNLYVVSLNFPCTLEIEGKLLKFTDSSGNYKIIKEEVKYVN